MITRLTTYLLEHQYGFLQTYDTPMQMKFEVFDVQDRPIVQLMVQDASDTAAWSATQALSAARHLAPDVARLLQHLLQIDA